MNYKCTLLQNHSNVYLQKIPIFAFRDLQCVSNISHNVTVYKQAFCYLQVMCVICFFIVFFYLLSGLFELFVVFEDFRSFSMAR